MWLRFWSPVSTMARSTSSMKFGAVRSMLALVNLFMWIDVVFAMQTMFSPALTDESVL